MAGNTFRGVGDAKEPSRQHPDDDAPQLVDEFEDSRGVNSGPTVVDDQKVAEVLKQLRALDQPKATPAVGVHAVDDANATAPVRIDPRDMQADSGPAAGAAPALARAPAASPIKSDPGPARLEDIMYPLPRPTAAGRAVSNGAGAAQPVTVPVDSIRGTMFGRSIHVPEVNAPDETEVELSSGAVHFLDGSPPTSQPYPLADGALPAPVPAGANPARPLGGPVPAPAPSRRFHTPYETTDTDLLRSRKKAPRMLALMIGIGIVGGGWFVWTQYAPPDEPAPAATAAAPPAPSVVPLPIPVPATTAIATPTATAAPEPAAPVRVAGAEPVAKEPVAAKEPAVKEPVAKEPVAAKEPAAKEPVAASEPTAKAPALAKAPPEPPARASSRAQTRRRSPPAPERSAAAQLAPSPDDDAPPAPAKPSRSRRRAVTEDPDATLPPSAEE